jgi:RNA-splicing ligase RtcB
MAHEMLPGTRAPVRMWADPASVEPDALAQLRNVASLPWTRQVAVIPDVHYGKGATVGSVIAMEQAISGCGRRGHRLRHECGALVHRQPASFRTTCPACGLRSRTGAGGLERP